MADTTVTRGRMTVNATGLTRVFQFNPNELKDQKGITFGTLQVPGASHPIYQYGAGGERILSFDLYLDGDRARFGRENKSPTDKLSIQPELNFYRSLVYPGQYDARDFSAAYPYLVLFTLGEYIDAMPCIVKQANVSINYWTPKMEPVRAVVAIELGEISTQSQTSEDVLSYGLGKAEGFGDITIIKNGNRFTYLDSIALGGK